MKQTTKYENEIIAKAKNNSPLRILYKKPHNLPEVKIIDNVFKLKKAIIEKKLDIIPYENVYIIYNKKKSILTKESNIILTFCSIYGDLILVDIDKKKREFKSLSEDNIIWYLQDLINKNFDSIIPPAKNLTKTY